MRVNIQIRVLLSLLIHAFSEFELTKELFMGHFAPICVKSLHLASVHRIARESSDAVLGPFDLVLAEPHRDHSPGFVLICSLLEEPGHARFLFVFLEFQIVNGCFLVCDLSVDLRDLIVFALNVCLVVFSEVLHVLGAARLILFDHLGGEVSVELVENHTEVLYLAGRVRNSNRGGNFGNCVHLSHFTPASEIAHLRRFRGCTDYQRGGVLFTFVELAGGDVLRHDVLLVLAANTTGRRRGMLRLNVLFVDGLVLLWRHGLLSVVCCGGQLTVFGVSAVAADLGLVDKVLGWLAAPVV